jgi:hypothetical protein
MLVSVRSKQAIRTRLKQHLQQAQDRMTGQANSKRREVTHQEGEDVMLPTKKHKVKTCRDTKAATNQHHQTDLQDSGTTGITCALAQTKRIPRQS